MSVRIGNALERADSELLTSLEECVCVRCGGQNSPMNLRKGLCSKCRGGGHSTLSVRVSRMTKGASKFLRWTIGLGSLAALAYLLFN
jgi:hypothetical protein